MSLNLRHSGLPLAVWLPVYPRGLRYNFGVNRSRYLPEREDLSVLMAVILLAYAIARFVQAPGWSLAINLAGVYLPLQININTVVSVLVAALAASGADWLLRSHPRFGERSSFSHLLLPALTAWVISLPLANLPLSPFWWAAFVGSGLLLLFVLLAEYVSVEREDQFYSLVSLVLSGIAYSLFLILAISLKALTIRLILTMPALAVGTLLISLRVQLLRAAREVQPAHLAAIVFITLQIAAALHYLPLPAVAYGLGLLGLVYALNSFLAAISLGQDARAAAREPLVALGLFWLLAVITSL